MTPRLKPRHWLEFSVPLHQPVLGVTRRNGWLIEGSVGWGEWSPLPSWSRSDAVRAYRGAVEAADLAFPVPIQTAVEVNAMVPRLAADEAARLAGLAVASGCQTIKVKVGDPGGLDRVRAIRAAVGRSTRIRLDANGAWDLATARTQLSRMALCDIELVEDPVANPADGRALRRTISIPVGIEMGIRTLDDVRRLRVWELADVLVVKPQRIGGITAALRAAEAARIPTIASSALETSVGLATVLAVAAALPPGLYAHGIGTGLLLATDVTVHPLLPVDGRLVPRRVVPDRLLGLRDPR